MIAPRGPNDQGLNPLMPGAHMAFPLTVAHLKGLVTHGELGETPGQGC